ncbi:MAG: V-type ATP synthase subunit E [Bacilli bacterium]
MGNSSIYKKIEEKGSLDAANIIKSGEMKAQVLHDDILAIASKEVAQLLEKATKRGQDLVKMKLTEQEQAAKQRTLAKKKALIDEVFDRVLESLLALKDEALTNLVISFINQETIVGDEIIYVSKNDFERFQNLFASNKTKADLCLLDKLNNKLNNPKAHLQLSTKPVNIKGGLILSGKAFDIDLSFETKIKSFKETYETKIAEILFGGE